MALSSILKRLLFVRQFDINEGKINLLGDREIMLDASALLALQEIDKSGLYNIGKKEGISKMKGAVQHANVYKEMKDVFIQEIARLGKKIGESDEGTIKTLQEIFNIYGLGEMTIQEIDNKAKSAVVLIKESTIAEEWAKRNKGRSKIGVCSLTAGVIAGMFSYIFDKEIDCSEERCRAAGNSYCLFRVG